MISTSTACSNLYSCRDTLSLSLSKKATRVITATKIVILCSNSSMPMVSDGSVVRRGEAIVLRVKSEEAIRRTSNSTYDTQRTTTEAECRMLFSVVCSNL